MSQEHEYPGSHAEPQATHEYPTPAVGAPAVVESEERSVAPKLSAFMKVSIIILVAVTLASISLLFIGDFDGKFERVFSTLALFTIFVLLTAFDTRRERAAHWYAPIALIANAYILGLLLIIIWVTPYDVFTLQMRITWTSVYVIVVTRVVVWAVGALLRIGTQRPSSVARWGQVTSVFAILTLILFTAPLGIEAFQVHVPDLYWRISVATLILTGLGLAVTLLLSWYYRPDKPAPQVNQQTYGVAAAPQAYPSHQGAPEAGVYPGSQPYPAAQTYPVQAAPPAPPVAPPAAPAPPVATPVAEPERLPWPTFADGTPYPMGADGQPDFAAVERMQATSVASEAHAPVPHTSEEQLHEGARLNGDVNDSVVPAEPAVAASSVLSEDPGIHAESLVTDDSTASTEQGPVATTDTAAPQVPETIVQDEAIHLPEMSRQTENDQAAADPADPLDEDTSKRS